MARVLSRTWSKISNHCCNQAITLKIQSYRDFIGGYAVLTAESRSTIHDGSIVTCTAKYSEPQFGVVCCTNATSRLQFRRWIRALPWMTPPFFVELMLSWELRSFHIGKSLSLALAVSKL
jgi:hypothetical protein